MKTSESPAGPRYLPKHKKVSAFLPSISCFLTISYLAWKVLSPFKLPHLHRL
ncbi:hypothetical protein BJX99DRAFT_229618 [Aspergillus californicus]